LHGALFFLDNAPARRLWGDEVMYAGTASRLLEGEPARLELLWPPLYPRFLAGGMILSGGSFLATYLFQTFLLVVSALLVRDLTARFVGPGLAPDLAMGFMLLDPTLAAFAHFLWPEVLHLFLLLVAIWIVAAHAEEARWLAFLGLVLGLAILTKSLLGPFLPVLLLPAVLRGSWTARVLRPALTIAVLSAVTAPVLFFNVHRSGDFLIADSSRFNLWVGLNDRSRKDLIGEVVGNEYGAWIRSAPDFATRDSILREKIRQFVAERGVIRIFFSQLSRQYFRLLDKDSFFTDQLPGGVLAGYRFGYVDPPRLLSQALRYLAYAVYVAALALGVWGVFQVRPAGRAWVWVVLAFLACNLAAFLLLHVKSRYRLQLVPFLSLYAAWAAAFLLGDPAARRAAVFRGTVPKIAGAFAATGAFLLALGGRLLP
jgi:4-amino-4-deoxy-L-arabinose transferase-like glycosyltransferase